MSDRNPAPMPSISELLVQVTVDLNAERQRAEAAEARLEELERERDEWMHGARLSAARNVFAEARLDRQQAVIEAAQECVSACDLAPAGEGKRQWCLTHQEWNYPHSPCPLNALSAALATLTKEEPDADK